jgi:hypothetical protein
MSIREANTMKKALGCLRCGRRMWTDRCHRICRRCHRANGRENVVNPVSIHLPGGRDMGEGAELGSESGAFVLDTGSLER